MKLIETSEIELRVWERALSHFHAIIACARFRRVWAFRLRRRLNSPRARAAGAVIQSAAAIKLLSLSVDVLNRFTPQGWGFAELSDFPYRYLPAPLQPVIAFASFLAVAATVLLWIHHHLLIKSAFRLRVLLGQLIARLVEVRSLDPSAAETASMALAVVREVMEGFNAASGQPVFGPPEYYCDLLLVKGGDLTRAVSEPFHAYNPSGTLPRGRGAAGMAQATGDLVYVPDVSCRHGIRIHERAEGSMLHRSFELAENVFVPLASDNPPFSSLLCVPFRRQYQATKGPFIGVVCFAGRRKGAFDDEFSFDAANLATLIISAAIDKCLTAQEYVDSLLALQSAVAEGAD